MPVIRYVRKGVSGGREGLVVRNEIEVPPPSHLPVPLPLTCRCPEEPAALLLQAALDHRLGRMAAGLGAEVEHL